MITTNEWEARAKLRMSTDVIFDGKIWHVDAIYPEGESATLVRHLPEKIETAIPVPFDCLEWANNTYN